MKRIRVIPSLLLKDGGLVKTARFGNPVYVGDPINAVKIFNEKEVDELALLDISATLESREPDIDKITEIASEAFMPLAYGGGVRTMETMRSIFNAGFEKVILNSAAFTEPNLIEKAADQFGSQSVVVCLDAKGGLLRKPRIHTHSGTRKTALTPVEAALELEKRGVGEIILHSIDREGTYKGYDIPLLKSVSEAVGIPVVALGGARNVDDLALAVHEGKASAVAAGSIFVFQGAQRGILINFPTQKTLEDKIFRHL